MTNRAVFVDKDGTLVENVPYNVDPSKIRLTQHAAAALARFHALGYRVIVVTNQSGVARGLFPESAVSGTETALRELVFAQSQVDFDGFYYCPHHPDGVVSPYAMECECRKPRPGLLLKAACEQDIDLSRSWMIGDILDDVEAGNRAGCKTVLIDCGNETEWVLTEERMPVYVAINMADAADYILSNDDS